MSKKIFLSPSNQDGNRYAYGNTTEDVQCGKIAVACKAALERCGFEVKCEQYDTSNAWGADMHIAIHTNAFDGKTGGTRVFYFTNNGYGNMASKAVYDRLKSLTPGTGDNISAYPGLYELKATTATAVYVEAEFHDVPEYAKWITEHTTEIGEAICKGVCDYCKVTYKEPAKQETPDRLYRVQVGAFGVKANAEGMLEKLKKAGFEGFIVTV